MKYLEQLDERFTSLASNDSQRSDRIAELSKQRKQALWAGLGFFLSTASVVWISKGAFWSVGCAAVACICGCCQFYQVNSELRLLKTVEVLKKQVLGNPL